MIGPVAPPSRTVSRNVLPQVAVHRYVVPGLSIRAPAARWEKLGSYLRSSSPIRTLYEIALSGFPAAPRYWTLNKNLLRYKLSPPSIMEKIRDFTPAPFGCKPSTSTEISPLVSAESNR